MQNRKFGSRGGMAAPGRMQFLGQIFLFRTPVYINNFESPKIRMSAVVWSSLRPECCSHERLQRNPSSYLLYSSHLFGASGQSITMGKSRREREREMGMVEVVEGLRMPRRGETWMGVHVTHDLASMSLSSGPSHQKGSLKFFWM